MSPYFYLISLNQHGVFVCRVYTQYGVDEKKKFYGSQEFDTYQKAMDWGLAYCDDDIGYVSGSSPFRKDLK